MIVIFRKSSSQNKTGACNHVNDKGGSETVCGPHGSQLWRKMWEDFQSSPPLRNIPYKGTKNHPEVFLPEIFLKSPGVMDLRTFGSRTSAAKCLPFQGFENLPEVCEPGRPPEWPADVRRVSVSKTLSLGCCFLVPDFSQWSNEPPRRCWSFSVFFPSCGSIGKIQPSRPFN